MEGFKATICESSKQLTTKERIKFKDTTGAVSIDRTSIDKDFNNEKFIINVDGYVVLDIHNEKAQDNTDYKNYIIIDKDGTKYVTGSKSFFSSFMDIWQELEEAGELDDFQIEVYRQPSKNYSGKDFLTCTIV